ncbi:LOW QUALITY PROTEIN: SH2 domain-containing protein 3C-like [Haliotis rubra]|uniref:LOW QUALITY PROTEIN: SH2 domain-containing protein 3C-like n=1 Tax=Haliotis rubra TaxID=36100 RepID=UPI001EE583B7|nr:LOW QUALITY PROTEIN: SH2 domain-containing protein 3C-like [Haliotis rubra]
MAMCRVEDSYQNLLRLVLERESRHQSRMAQKHIAVSTWLEALGMLEYLATFHQYGGVEELLYIQEAEIRDLGIKNSAHRAKLVSSLRILRDKYQKGRLHCSVSGRTSPSSALQQHLQTSPPSPLSHPDYHSLQVSPEKLRQDLQRELNADPSELKSRSWYHGNISRQRAETLVTEDGDFLVRDCISRPGDFVLTCCWKAVPLHFMINALVGDSLLGALPKIYYQFEDESFNSIQVLIHYYQSKGKPVTNASSAVLRSPIARSMPLSYYDSKYGALTSLAAVNIYSSRQSPRGSPLSTPTGSPFGSPGMNRKGPKRTGSQPLLSMDDMGDDRSRSPSMDRCDSLPMINTPTASPQLSGRKEFQPVYHQRAGSEPVLTPNGGLAPCPQNGTEKGGSDSDLSKPPPPKPSRIPSVKYKQRPVVEVRNKFLYEDDGRDYSDYCQVKESPSWLTDNQNNVMNRVKQLNSRRLDNDPHGDKDIYDNNFNNLKKTLTSTPNMKKDPASRMRLFSDTRFSVIDTSEPDSPNDIVMDNQGPESCVYDVKYLRQRKITTPKVKSHMSYSAYDFKTSLLQSDNKPLDASSMISVKTILLDGSPKVIAQHMTKVDLQSLNILKEHDFGVGVQSGLELLTLPQGKQLRQDLIERCHCMKLLVMVSTLTCATTTERARMANQWIQIASELKTTMGNLFGFVSVMDALVSQQIQRLRDMWLVLRQNHTGSAYLFDTKLKTAYSALNDGSSSLPLAKCVYSSYKPGGTFVGARPGLCHEQSSRENMDKALFGTEIFLAHLDTARIIASQFALYHIVGSSVVSEMKENNEMTDVFKTETQLRLFWGLKGCGVNRSDRHSKFDQLLTVLSDRAEPPGDDGTAV